MIGKTNSIIVKGGDTPTPATVDKYKGLRPSYWPTIKMPNELEENQTYELLMEVQWLGDAVSVPLFRGMEGYVDWGDGSGKQPTQESHTYNQSDFPAAIFNGNPKTSYIVIKVYGAVFKSILTGSILPDNVKIVEVSSKDNTTLYFSSQTGNLWSDVLFYSFWQTDTQYGYAIDYNNLPKCVLWPYSRFSFLKYRYNINILSPLVEFPELIIDNKTEGGFEIHDADGKFASVSNDKLQEIPFYLGFTETQTGTKTGTAELQFFPYTQETNWGDMNSSFYYNSAPNNIGYNIAPADWGMINLYVDSRLTFTQYHNFFGNTYYMKISPYIKPVNNSSCDWKYLFYDYSYLQVAKLDPSLLVQNENSLQEAFYNCHNLRMVIMPGNSLKVPIDLSAITTWYSDSYTDPIYQITYSSLSEYAWTTIAQALYNFTTAGETLSYTPTLTINSTIYSNLQSIYINGTLFTDYITNKGWTIAEV